MKATLTSKGQVTIPKQIREYLQIDHSDTIDFKIAEDGKVYIYRPIQSVKKLSGLLSNYKKSEPVTIEQMDDIIHDEANIRVKK